MKFSETTLPGSYIIELEPHEDERGFFSRTFCKKKFKELGLNMDVKQCNISHNSNKATMRGLHYQAEPHMGTRLVSCIRGAIYDVIVDLRPGSNTYTQWFAAELTADNHKMLYIPEGLAHGFQTLMDDTEVFYQMSEFYYPELARGVRWNDPAFGIDWPLAEPLLSGKDRHYTDFIAVTGSVSGAGG